MGLVAHWKLDGDTRDSVGDYHGIEHGSLSYANGKIGQCLSLSGAANTGFEAMRHNDAFSIQNEFTIAAWFKSTATGDSDGNRIMSRDVSDYFGWYLYQSQAYPQTLRLYYSDTQATNVGSLDSSWNHLCTSWNLALNRVRMYINGELVWETTNFSGFNSSSRPIVFGGNTEGDGDISGSEVVGDLDDIRIYNHEVSQKKVKELSKAKILHYKFDEFQEPTNNIIPGSGRTMTSATDFGISNYGEDVAGSMNHEFLTNNYGREDVLKATFDYSQNGRSADFVIRFPGLVSTAVGEEYVFSYDYLLVSGTTIPNNPILYQDGWKTAGSATKTFLWEKDVGNGWKRRAYKFTITSAGNAYLRFSSGYKSSDFEWRYDNLQFEKKPYATPFYDGSRESFLSNSTPYGQRSNINLTSTPQWDSNSYIGSGCYYFDGNNKEFVIPNSSCTVPEGTEITISWWQKWEDAGDQDHPVLAKNPGSSWNPGNGFVVGHGWGSSFYFGIGNNNASANIGLTQNTWHHVVITYKDGVGVKIYRDNNLEYENAAWSGPVGSNVENLIIGKANYRGGSFKGNLADIRIYGSFLDADEVERLYRTRASLDSGGNLLPIVSKEPLNLIDQYGDFSWDFSDINSTGDSNDLVPYTQSEVSCSIANEGYIGDKSFYINRTANLDYSVDGRVMWGGFRLRTHNYNYTPGTYKLSFWYKGHTSNTAEIYFAWTAGWTGKGGLGRGASLSGVPAFDSDEWLYYEDTFTLTESDIWKASDGSDGMVAGQFYNIMRDLKIGFDYEDTDSQGTHFYIDGLKITPLDHTSNNHLKEEGIYQSRHINEIGVSEGMQLYIPFNSGSMKDLSGNGYEATGNGVVQAASLNGTGYEFTAANGDYIDLGSDITFKTGGGWTVETIVKYNTVADAYTGGNESPANFIGHGSNSYNCWYWSVLNKKLALWDKAQGTWKYGDTILQPDVWYHAVIVCYDDGTKYRFFLNGEPEGGSHATFSWTAADSGLKIRYIGSASGGVRFTDGIIDSTRVWTRALSHEEVKMNYELTGGSDITKFKQAPHGSYSKGQFIEI